MSAVAAFAICSIYLIYNSNKVPSKYTNSWIATEDRSDLFPFLFNCLYIIVAWPKPLRQQVQEDSVEN